jgi:hypothetical protein
MQLVLAAWLITLDQSDARDESITVPRFQHEHYGPAFYINFLLRDFFLAYSALCRTPALSHVEYIVL